MCTLVLSFDYLLRITIGAFLIFLLVLLVYSLQIILKSFGMVLTRRTDLSHNRMMLRIRKAKIILRLVYEDVKVLLGQMNMLLVLVCKTRRAGSKRLLKLYILLHKTFQVVVIRHQLWKLALLLHKSRSTLNISLRTHLIIRLRILGVLNRHVKVFL